MRKEELLNRYKYLSEKDFIDDYENIIKMNEKELEECLENFEDILRKYDAKKELKAYYKKFNIKKELLQKNIVYYANQTKEAIHRGNTEVAIFNAQKTIKYLNKYKLKFESKNYLLDDKEIKKF